VNVTQTFALTPSSGPVGTPIELKVTGLGWHVVKVYEFGRNIVSRQG
jgi:hypothetical protein